MTVLLWDSNGNYREASYETFQVGTGPGYQLTVDGFSSPEGYKLYDALTYHSNGMDFSTKESDKDFDDDSRHCASDRFSAGW